IRLAAQIVHTAVMNDLHKNDLLRASDDLISLLSFPSVYRSNPSLVCYMIRIAIVGLSTDVCWDALQADGWTDAQLARIQAACIDANSILVEMPRTLETERLVRIYQLDSFRSHSYESWIARHQDLFASFGYRAPPSDVAWNARTLRQY